MKICFFGSQQIAGNIIQYLFQQKQVEILQVITKVDKKQGRGMKQTSSVVKNIAQELALPIYQITDWQDISFLPKKECDFFVVVNFGKIFPQSILDFPQKSCLNIHFSLLPRWRGASPIRACLQSGDEFSGISIMKMVKKLDAGDILSQEKVKITPHMDYQSLTNNLLKIACVQIDKVLKNYDTICPIVQNPKLVTYSAKITKEDGLIQWENGVENIYRLYQAFSPKPGIFSYWGQKKIFLRKISILSRSQNHEQSGVIIGKSDKGLEVSTSKGVLLLESLQMENKKTLLAKDWYNGYRVTLGEQFQ